MPELCACFVHDKSVELWFVFDDVKLAGSGAPSVKYQMSLNLLTLYH